MNRCFPKVAAAVLLAASCAWRSSAAIAEEDPSGGRRWVRALLHLNTTVSAGDRSAEELVRLAEERGVEVVGISDQLLARGEYGVWPLRRIVRRVYERQSILTYGVTDYFAMLDEVDLRHPGVTVLPGADVAPFYYWSGKPWRGDLKVHDWSRQLIVLGLVSPGDYEALPVVTGPGARGFRPGNLLGLWPLLLVLAGVWLVRHRAWDYRDESGVQLAPVSRPCLVLGTVALLAGALLLVNNVQLIRAPRYDQYHGPQGAAPYQEFIDAARARGALVFWSQLEAGMEEKWGEVLLETRPHASDLLKTRGYTGFGAVYGDQRTAHLPGREWDRALLEYCAGERAAPPWAIAESDYRGDPDGLTAYETLLLLEETTRESVLAALGSGRSAAVYNYVGGRPVLEDFRMTDPAQGTEAVSGGELVSGGPVRITLRGHGDEVEGVPTFKVKVICDGVVVHTAAVPGLRFDTEFTWTLEGAEPGTRHYCRVIVDGWGELVTNPIFVKIPGRP